MQKFEPVLLFAIQKSCEDIKFSNWETSAVEITHGQNFYFCLSFTPSLMIFLTAALKHPSSFKRKKKSTEAQIYTKKLSNSDYSSIRIPLNWSLRILITYVVSVSDLCFISIISTMCRSIGSPGFLTAKTESTTAWNRGGGKSPKGPSDSKVQAHMFLPTLCQRNNPSSLKPGAQHTKRGVKMHGHLPLLRCQQVQYEL